MYVLEQKIELIRVTVVSCNTSPELKLKESFLSYIDGCVPL